jgi:hypothetical protein
MAGPELALEARARRAYERGRVRAALPTAALAVPMTVLSLLLCGREAATLVCGTLLAAALVGALWRGQEVSRGARVGLLAGAGPFALPLALQCTTHACVGGTCLLFPGVCIAGGILAGLAVAAPALRRVPAPASWGYVLPALVVAGLAGSLGCVMAGTVGVVGMAGGMALGTAPLLLRASAAAR